jgi:tetratricopeptide (TPR) repeat protein
MGGEAGGSGVTRIGAGRGRAPSAAAMLALTLLLAAMTAPELGAQDTAEAGLDRVQALMDEGRVDNARRAYEQWWDRWSAEAPRDQQQRSLWLRALLSIDPAEAELDYRRLVLEYPTGPWTDGALLRLGYAAEARGATAEAREHFQRLVRDHPGSPHVAEANRRLSGGERPAIAGPDAPRVATPPQPPPPPPAAPSGNWAVQLGAFSAMSGARGVADRARAAGYQPRLVVTPGSPLIRVRLGGFPDEGGARALLGEVRSRGLEATVVSDALRESPAG